MFLKIKREKKSEIEYGTKTDNNTPLASIEMGSFVSRNISGIMLISA